MKILFLQKRPLFPTNDGGKVRTLNVLRHLARWHEVTYLCNLLAEEEPYVSSMESLGVRLVTIPWRETNRGTIGFYRDLARNLLSPYPFNVSKDYDRRLRNRAKQILRDERFDLIICDFVQMARNAMGLPGPRRVLFQHNVEAEIFKRHATTGPGWLRRKYMALQWRKMRRFERNAGLQFDRVVAVSDRDAKIFERDYGWRHVSAIDTAVDIEYFRPNGVAEHPDRLVFVGSMDWLPNPDGVTFFIKEVWPRIREARPNSTFQVVGRNASASIRRLGRSEGIEVFSDVPDVRPYLSEASVVVVPLLVGGGTRLKIFEAMAMGKAVLSTSLGAEGLKVTPGEHIELADAPSDFADKAVSLLSDPGRRAELGRNAREYVVADFSAEKIARQFDEVCRLTAGLEKPAASDAPAVGLHEA